LQLYPDLISSKIVKTMITVKLIHLLSKEREEDGSRKSEVRSQKPEVGRKKKEDRSRKPEVGRKKTEVLKPCFDVSHDAAGFDEFLAGVSRVAQKHSGLRPA